MHHLPEFFDYERGNNFFKYVHSARVGDSPECCPCLAARSLSGLVTEDQAHERRSESGPPQKYSGTTILGRNGTARKGIKTNARRARNGSATTVL